MSQVTSAHGQRDGLPPVPSIPLADDRTLAAADQSIGDLVKDATTHISTLLRAEVELAKAELAKEVKKTLIGAGAIFVALVLVVYATFFLLFTLAEGLADMGVDRWGAFAITFGVIMVLFVALGIIGWKLISSFRKPKRTIDSVKETAAALRNRGSDESRV